MGRHARGARLQRVPVATIVLGGLVVVVIGVGTWVGLSSQQAPTVATVDASAVVVSSPPCNSASAPTVVDVLDRGAAETGGTTRAELAGCGYREGQVLAVQHAVGDPTQVAIAEAVDTTDLQPLGMLAALLLVIAVAVAAWYDAGRWFRRSRRIDLPGNFAESPVPGGAEPGLSAGWIGAPTAERDDDDAPATRTGRHALIEPTDTEVLRAVLLGSVESDPPTPAPVVAAPLWEPSRESSDAPRSESSDIDLVFTFDADFAASLKDELFTHRGAPSLP